MGDIAAIGTLAQHGGDKVSLTPPLLFGQLYNVCLANLTTENFCIESLRDVVNPVAGRAVYNRRQQRRRVFQAAERKLCKDDQGEYILASRIRAFPVSL